MDLPDPDDRLNSWKEIGAFLGRTTRTVQRWEKTDGLPLRRGGPGHRGAVVASKRELAEWWARREAAAAAVGTVPVVPDRWRPGFRSLAVVAGLVALALVVQSLDWRSGAPAGASGQGRLLAASTSEGGTTLSIPLPGEPAGIAVAPDGRTAYVALPALGEVAVVDIAERRVLSRMHAVEGAESLALDSDGDRLVVGGTAEVGVLDLRDGSLERFVTGHPAHSLRATADGRFVWLPLLRGGLKVLDLDTGRLDDVPTVGCPAHVTAAPRSGRIFVSYQCGGPGGRPGHDAIEVFDEETRATLMARAGPPLVGSALAVSPDEQHLWAATHDACAIAEYDQQGCPPGRGPVLHAFSTRSLELLLTARIPHGDSDAYPTFFPDGSRVAVAANGLFVLDRETGTVVEADPQFPPGQVAFASPDGPAVVAQWRDRSVVVLPLTPPVDPASVAGLGVHWTGDGTANDVVGGTHAVAGQARFVPGRLGRAFAFERTDSGIEFGRRLDVDIGTPRATYAAWLRPADSGAPLTIASRTSREGWRWWLTAAGQPAWCLASAPARWACGTGGLVADAALVPGAWSHVAVVRGDEDLTVFVDGRPVGSAPIGAPEPAPVLPYDAFRLRLGADEAGGTAFSGLIDEVVMYRRALTAEEIRRVMAATSIAR